MALRVGGRPHPALAGPRPGVFSRRRRTAQRRRPSQRRGAVGAEAIIPPTPPCRLPRRPAGAEGLGRKFQRLVDTLAAASSRRRRAIRRRSRSEAPPHTPCSMWLRSAYSRHGSLTGQSAQRRRATSTPTPSLGKNTSGGLVRQFPCVIQSSIAYAPSSYCTFNETGQPDGSPSVVIRS